MSTEVICAIISGLVSTVCAGLAAWATVRSSTMAKQIHEEQEKTAERAKRRAEESRLSMNLMHATCALALTISKKMNGMHTNGDVEDAMSSAAKAQGEYENFVRSQVAMDVAKV